ncbi:hypothetical protein KUTeg_000208 [Tegillarca granosa]|uniref:Farnesoic acid O-methyl transferase domain-containing protein n=1 Tax=Tegillarca granosa TaxID=220873 RepID=A0ABQ9FY20_TEGGR|nr:hypothetical protein KUTeg_000208 [Tegillarca granosa]
MACNDAHLALCSNSGPLYEIVIGGWGNGQSVIRDRKQGSNLAAYRGSVLSCGSYNYFWISWSGGTVRVGKGTSVGSSQMMSWYDSTPHSVDYAAVSTGWGATGRWEVVVNGGWSSWGGYGSCSRSCGSGTKTRYRSCNNPSPSGGGSSCSGSSSSSASCNTHSCPDCLKRICEFKNLVRSSDYLRNVVPPKL